MTEAARRRWHRRGHRKPPEERRHDVYLRRLALAGIAPQDGVPEERGAFRIMIARRMSMAMNRWQGCAEPLCKRECGCMAPNIVCANAPKAIAARRSRHMQDRWALLRRLALGHRAARKNDSGG